MEPRNQYATTDDGVSIAYTTTGEGTPLVRTAKPGYNHIQLQLQDSQSREWFDSLNHRLVHYDGRNGGLSSASEDHRLDALGRDLDAVVQALGLDRFALYGSGGSGPLAITYAATHPSHVSRLILFCTIPDAARDRDERYETLLKLADDDWELFTQSFIQLVFNWEGGPLAKAMTKDFRERFTAEEWLVVWDKVRAHDATPLLEDVACPTLVLQRQDVKAPSLDTARLLASRIPNAHLVLLEGDANVPQVGDVASVTQAINEFLAADADVPSSQAPTAPQAADTHTILFTDMEGSTTLADRLGDAAAQDVRRVHNEIVRAALGEHDGREIKHTGDGIMASFAAASSALDCAIAIQQGVATHQEANPESPLGVYVGLNAGEPIVEEGDLFGTSINLAARICDHAEAGQILAANVVRELAAGKDFLFADLGETELRGFEDPVKLWELLWEPDGPA